MYDAEILGAGSAGSYAAIALARKGYSVHPVDRATYPRDRPGGGGLTRKSLNLIEGLGPSFGSTGLAEHVRDLYPVSPDTTECRLVSLPPNDLAPVHRLSLDTSWPGRVMDADSEFAYSPGTVHFTAAADGASSEMGSGIRGPFPNDEVAVAAKSMSP